MCSTCAASRPRRPAGFHVAYTTHITHNTHTHTHTHTHTSARARARRRGRAHALAGVRTQGMGTSFLLLCVLVVLRPVRRARHWECHGCCGRGRRTAYVLVYDHVPKGGTACGISPEPRLPMNVFVAFSGLRASAQVRCRRGCCELFLDTSLGCAPLIESFNPPDFTRSPFSRDARPAGNSR